MALQVRQLNELSQDSQNHFGHFLHRTDSNTKGNRRREARTVAKKRSLKALGLLPRQKLLSSTVTTSEPPRHRE